MFRGSLFYRIWGHVKVYAGVKAVVCKEGRHLRRFIHSIVNSEFGHAKLLLPVCLGKIYVLSKVLLENLISVLSLAVGLMVPRCRERLFDSERCHTAFQNSKVNTPDVIYYLKEAM